MIIKLLAFDFQGFGEGTAIGYFGQGIVQRYILKLLLGLRLGPPFKHMG